MSEDIIQYYEDMAKEDIQRYLRKYADAALRAKKAGCDAVEIHCAHGHALLGSFLFPIVNHRTDEYGGSILGRARFLIEVCRSIRNAVGEDFPVSVRLSASDCKEGGNTAEDTAMVVRMLENQRCLLVLLEESKNHGLPICSLNRDGWILYILEEHLFLIQNL